MVRPLRALTDAVTRMGGGDLTTPVEVTLQDGAGLLAQQLEEMRRRLRKSLNALAIEKSLYEGIFQSMADGVFTTDATGNITSANPRAQALLHDAASLTKGWGCCVGFTLSDSTGQLLCDRVCLNSLRGGLDNAAVSKAQLRRPGDDPLDVEVTVSPIRDEEGNQIGLVHVLRDVSAQAELQRMKQRFLLSVAHELRTPLSSLAASVAILQEDDMVMAAEDRERMLAMINRSTVRLQHLITNLLDLGSIEAGRFAVQAQPMDLAAVVQEAVGICEPLLALKRQRVAVLLPTECPRVSADSRRITQVLVNLLSNCAKYGPEDDEVLLEVHRSGGFVYVSVTDHGRGMDPAEAEHVFEYFYQANRRKGQESQGFGLGLAIVSGIVEAHGGETGAESIPGRGTTIWFSLPIATTPARRVDALQVLARASATLD
ncbi:MAG: HAMP domain-containing protein [Chloroflexi bacterium]|nr:HAMP domain-containing protein [Chloroflexota bacterium]